MKDELGSRMKNFYESRSRTYLTRREPVIIRVDGKAFHTFTKGMLKPFDSSLILTMQLTAREACKKIQGCKLAYVQSDEISFLLTDWENLNTEAWFDYDLQKLVSISASIATAEFNKHYEWVNEQALFDSRAFSIPKEEVCNYFIWRQQDAIRNSIQAIAQSEFSHKELQGKNTLQMKEMLLSKDIDFEKANIVFQRGSCIYKSEVYGWKIDNEIPIFTKDRYYIERLVEDQPEDNPRFWDFHEPDPASIYGGE